MRRVAPAVALAAVALLSAGRAWACSCVAESVRTQLRGSDAVFEGSVRSVRTAPTQGESAPSIVAALLVESVYKGRPASLSRVRTARSGEACGIPFAVGRRYVVFADGRGGAFRADICGGTTSDLAALERVGIAPRAMAEPSVRPGNAGEAASRLPVVVLALAAAGAGGLAVRAALQRARRRRALS